ncbi:hypothetical protein [Secundilactobacillus silagei]|uniref:Uncharacterized protein n=1 Tax=Secundilactobacillus silagei JCM 19001 TaxID=1302250 RepID=A0A1Z5IFZ9_9LACO|nr:hypothetical protein [Secundilactobacillus silagei]TDG70562.1 hypothetical protein C5L25_002358 [Secundilactobacillus silagei JCM 19001]GAX00588.1 hypothetical protein IWT126_00603 [Secundilactobacillus silagei JCM 19001]
MPESAIATKAPVVPMDRWQDLAHQYGLATLPDSWREASESLRHQRNIDYLETFNDREEIYYTLIGNEFLQDIVCYHPEQVHTYWLKDLAQYVFIIE